VKVYLQQNAFNSGELSPQMLGRSDVPAYNNGVKTLENWLLRPQGGAMKRSGTRYVAEVEDSSVKSRVVPFVFSTTQAYVLEFCDLKIRFFRNESVIEAPTWTFVDGDVDTGNDELDITGHFYVDEQGPFRLTSDGTLPAGLSLATNYYIVEAATGTPADSFSLSLTAGGAIVPITGAAGGGTHTITPYGTVPNEIVTTYTEAQLPSLRFAQSADKLYIVHEDHKPAVLTRTGHASWTLSDLDFIDGPYLELRVPEVDDEKLLEAFLFSTSGVTGSVTLTAGAPGFFDNVGARDVGRMIRYHDPDSGDHEPGALRITAVASATSATGTVTAGPDPLLQPPALPDIQGTKEWYLGAYYFGNHPRTVAFFEQRLAFAGTPLEPERFDASVTGGWDDFAPTSRIDSDITADSALSYQLGGSSDVQVIVWLARARNMVIGTTGGVWIVQASSNNESVTPTNINLPRASAYGCANLQPVVAYNTVLYVSRSGKKVLAAGYQFESDNYNATDLTIMAEHVTGTGIIQMEFQQEPHSIIWCVRSDGKLAGVTYEPGQKIHGWHRHVIGGSFSTGDAVVESIAVIPAPNEDHDQLWMIVKRTIDGSTVRYIEFMEQDFADLDDIEDAFFVDSGLTYDSTATATITGLDHLEGETVSILADGAVHPTRVVSGGSITLNAKYSVVQVGYGYNADFETLPIEIRTQGSGSTSGRLLRPTHLHIRLHRTLGLEYGTDSDSLERLPFRSTSDDMDASPPLFTGIKEITMQSGHDEEAIVYLRQPDPLPAMILFVSGTVGIASR
jgi:hypothetical protein